MSDLDIIINKFKSTYDVEDQYEIAKALAANCGYQLIAEDIERSLEIKAALDFYKNNKNNVYFSHYIIEGLEALLK